MADLIDLVKNANDSDPTNFMSNFNDLIGQKALDMLHQRKQEIAMNMFSPENAEEQEINTDFDVDQEPVETTSEE